MRHALAVRQDNNGDVILAGPAIRGLAAAFDRVTVLCSPHGEAAARLLPGVDAVVVARTEWIDAAPRRIDRAATLALVDRIAALRVDDAFVFGSFHQSPLPTALVLRLAGVPRVHAVSVDYPGSLLDTRAAAPDDNHEVERNLRLLAAAGIPPPPDDRLELQALPARDRSLPESYVVVHPGATVPARAWSADKNRSLVAALAARGERVLVTGSAAERALCAFVSDGEATVVCDRSFAAYAAVVRDARAIVVGNTAGAHVAAAVGTPVVSLFAPTIPPVRFRPWRVPHALLGVHGIACAGCRARTCPIPGQPCLGDVEVAEVLAALSELAPANRAAVAAVRR